MGWALVPAQVWRDTQQETKFWQKCLGKLGWTRGRGHKETSQGDGSCLEAVPQNFWAFKGRNGQQSELAGEPEKWSSCTRHEKWSYLHGFYQKENFWTILETVSRVGEQFCNSACCIFFSWWPFSNWFEQIACGGRNQPPSCVLNFLLRCFTYLSTFCWLPYIWTYVIINPPSVNVWIF